MVNLKDYKPEWIPLSQIDLKNKEFQYRMALEIADLEESFRQEGQIFPVVLWRRNSGVIQIVCGFRRCQAAMKLKWEKILAVVVPESGMSREQALEISFLENLKRKSLTDMDLAFSCKRLHDEGISNIEIGRLIGKSESIVRRNLKVLDTPPEIQNAVWQGKLTLKDLSLIPETEVPALPNSFTEVKKLIDSKKKSAVYGSFSEIPGYMDKFMKKAKSLSGKRGAKSSFSRGGISEDMYIKRSGSGFNVILKLEPGKIDIEKSINFIAGVQTELQKLKKELSKSQKAVSGNDSVSVSTKTHVPVESKAAPKPVAPNAQEPAASQNEPAQTIKPKQPISPALQPTKPIRPDKSVQTIKSKHKQTIKAKHAPKPANHLAPIPAPGRQAPGVSIEYLYIQGPSAVKVGNTVQIKVEAYDSDQNRIKKPGAINPAWEIDNPNIALISHVTGTDGKPDYSQSHIIKLTANAPGICWLKATQGSRTADHAIEVK